jgi:polyhydroxybutyrate depolymerase
VAAIGLTVAQPAHAADGSATLVVDGAIRSYAIHVPDRARRWADFRSFWPSMAGDAGQGMRRLTHLDRQADARGVIIVYPDGLDRHWNDGRSTIRNPHDDVGFVSALLDRIGRDYRIDAGRVYATGISNGALFAQRLGCDLSQRIAAIAPVAGSMPADIADRCRLGRPLAVLEIGGTADPIMPFQGGPFPPWAARAKADRCFRWPIRRICGPGAMDAGFRTGPSLPPVAPSTGPVSCT